jgi:uncharacterized protein (DUF885 family)
MIENSARFAIAPLALLLALLPVRAPAQTYHDEVQKFFQSYFETRLRDYPEFATDTGHYENAGKWSDWSKPGRELRRRHAEEALSAADKFSTDSLPDSDQVSLRLLKYNLRLQLDAEDLEMHLLRVAQVFGLHNSAYITVDRMPGRTVRDYENILARLHGLPAYVDQNIDLLNESIARGLTQPRVVVDLVIKQVQAQTAQDSATTPLLAAFRRFPSNVPPDQQKKLHDEAVAAYEDEFLPAWKKLLTFFQTTYAPKARPDIGLSNLPGGREDYAILVRRQTTTNASPEEIHKIGEAEVQRLEAEMLAVARETGFAGTLGEFDKKLGDTPEQHFRSKDDMLVYCRNAAMIIQPELPNLFRRIPILLYGIRALPEDREQATASTGRAPPVPDGSVPGWFGLNTYQPEKQLRYDKEALVLHEAVPGHVFQGALARSQQNLPEFRKFYGNAAYGEGWALYAEGLGAQLGLYKDPYSRYGRLAMERFRAVRLVVDTGMHTMGWSREQALDYVNAHPPQVSPTEVDRYISWPGQALSYKMGQLKILELRREAEQKLGPKFDVRDFHDAILRDGPLPLDLLQLQVEKYVAAAGAAR